MLKLKKIIIREEFFDEKAERKRIRSLFRKTPLTKLWLSDILDAFCAGDMQRCKELFLKTENVEFEAKYSDDPVLEYIHPQIFEFCQSNAFCKSVEKVKEGQSEGK